MLTLAWKVLYAAWVSSELLILFATRRRAAHTADYDQGSLRILWLVIASSIFAASWYGAAHASTIAPGARWPSSGSAALLALALALRWSAVVTLGKSFTANVTIRSGQTLYRSGLFAVVRHPSYTGLILVFVALGFHTRNWVSLLILLAPPTAALLYRIRIEEQALTVAFGAEYTAYSARTKRLIPGVY